MVSTRFLGWSGLVFVLCYATFGLSVILHFFLFVIVLVVTVVFGLYVIGAEPAEEYWNAACLSRLELPSNGIPCVKKKVLEEEQRTKTKLDKRLTGSSVIDEQLHEIIQLTIRDYILLWYQKIGNNERFPESVEMSAHQVIITFAERVKHVDWIQFCTIQLFEDVSSHFRLFRDSQKKHADQKTKTDLVATFFKLESELNRDCLWNDICMDSEQEKLYLRDLSEVIIYLLLPSGDFSNKLIRYLLRDLLVNCIFLPTINLFSDPDYVNQTIIWLCKNVPITSDGFLTVMRLTNCVDELLAVQEKVNEEIAVLRSKDSGGSDDTLIKQQLGSVLFLKRVVDHRLKRLQEGVDTDSTGLPARFDWKKVMSANYKLYNVSLDAILKNNVALSYFIDFMMCTGNQAYMFFYLTVEGYRVSAEQHISQLQLEQMSASCSSVNTNLEPLREAALNIYEQYISSKAVPRIKVDDGLSRHLLQNLKTEVPTETWFDEVQAKVLELLSEEKFYGAFKKSPQYIKMLAELDLLKDISKSDEDDLQSLDELLQTNSDSRSIPSSLDDSLHSDSTHASSLSNAKKDTVKIEGLTLRTKIVGTGPVKDAMKSYVVYAVEVIKSVPGAKDEKWQVYRRYSDFYDFHMSLMENYGDFVGHNFPGKKTFNNMNQEFLGKRMQQLNDYLIFLLKPETYEKYSGLQEYVLRFLEPVSYSKGKGQFVKKVNKIVLNPIRDGVRSMGNMVKTVPDNFIQSVDNAMDGLCRTLHGKSAAVGGPSLAIQEEYRMTVGLDYQNEEDIPLRILLLLVDEVFDLKNRNQWLRRRMVQLLREFIKTMYGDRINRTILEYVEWLTSAEQIAEYIKAFKNTIWPNGFYVGPVPPRDKNTIMRTRVAAKVAMLCLIPDEMKHIIGSETTRKGVHLVFEMFQQPALNKRLLYELFERVLKLIFPENNIPAVLKKLHSKEVLEVHAK